MIVGPFRVVTLDLCDDVIGLTVKPVALGAGAGAGFRVRVGIGVGD